jgi:glycosyltransferase involved in cell wall biosynthesis
MPSCVIIVENLPVPFDRRPWQEAKALASVGWDVSIICPLSTLHSQHQEVIEGITIYRHPLRLEARGRFGFIFEYAQALFHETCLTWKIYLKQGIDVIHVCNPPDLIFLVAIPFRLLGVRFVFDQHDLCPELYLAKFHGRRQVSYWALRVCERISYRTADLVITANDRFKAIGARRNHKSLATFSGVIEPSNSDPKEEPQCRHRGVDGEWRDTARDQVKLP